MIAPGKGGYIFRGFEFRGSSIRCTAYRMGGGRQRSITPPQDVPCIYATKIPIELLRLCITKAPHLCSAFRHALFFNIQCICVTKTPFVCQDNLFFRSASPDYHSATPESEKEVWRQKNFRALRHTAI